MTRIYLITPPAFDPVSLRDPFAAALDAGDIACVQLRLKEADDATWQRAVETLMPLCWDRDIAFIINDRADLAKRFSADGVHLGRDDISYDAARKLLGPDKIIGMSCYDSKDDAFDLANAGADYVAFGSAYPTTTKQASTSAPLALFEDWCASTTTPCVAIGGITPFNCGPLVKADVDFLAVIGAVWNDPESPAAGIKALQKAIEHAGASQ
jgi:thiamine-phosphate pyrophosphorylase